AAGPKEIDMRRACASLLFCLAPALVLAAGCAKTQPAPASTTDGGAPPSKNPDPAGPPPFAPLPPNVYGQKVKNLLTGLALTDAELTRLSADPGSLPALIDGWMELPQWRERMLDFFKQAFQQTQTDINNYDDQLGRTTN